jgi:hypothetical protein
MNQRTDSMMSVTLGEYPNGARLLLESQCSTEHSTQYCHCGTCQHRPVRCIMRKMPFVADTPIGDGMSKPHTLRTTENRSDACNSHNLKQSHKGIWRRRGHDLRMSCLFARTPGLSKSNVGKAEAPVGGIFHIVSQRHCVAT